MKHIEGLKTWMGWEFKNSAICSAREYFDEVKQEENLWIKNSFSLITRKWKKKKTKREAGSAWEKACYRKKQMKDIHDHRKQKKVDLGEIPKQQKWRWKTKKNTWKLYYKSFSEIFTNKLLSMPKTTQNYYVSIAICHWTADLNNVNRFT